MQLMIRGMLVGVLLVTASALEAQQRQPQQPGQAQPGQPQPGQPPRTVQPQQDVVAMVNGDAITQTEVQATLKPQLQGKQVDPRTAEKLRQQTLDTLIESRLIEQHAVKNGPDVGEQEVEASIARLKQQLAAQKIDFNQFLASRGYTATSLTKRIEGSLSWQKYQQQQLTPEKLRKFFEKHRDQFEGKGFEEAQNEVTRVYMGALWDDIVNQMKPKAEIKIVKPEGSRRPGRRQPSSPRVPQ